MNYQSAREVLDALILNFYDKRDLEGVLSCVAPDMEWIGTEKQENISGKEEIRKMIALSIQTRPEPFRVHYEQPREQKVSEDVTIFTMTGQYLEIPGADYDLNVRATVCCVKAEQGWLIKSMHVSTPNIGGIKRRLETELSETQKKEWILQNSIPGGTAIYRMKKDGHFETDYVSDNLAKILGYEDYQGLLDVVKENVKNAVVPEDWELILTSVETAIKNHEAINATYHVFSKDHKKVGINMRGNVIAENQSEDDLAVVYAVHTILKEEEIQEQKHFRNIINMLGIAYWEWTKNYGFYASEKFQKYVLSERPIEQMKNNNVLDDAIHPEDLGKLQEFFSHGDRNERNAATILRMKLKDGTYQWTEIIGFKEYAETGETIRLSCVMRGVGKEWIDQKHLLETAIQEAQQANQSKSEFLSRISHDMRTPLNGIQNYAQFISEAQTLEEAKDYGKKIQTSEHYLQTLINDTLGMSRIESGNVKLNPEPYVYTEFEPSIRNVVEPKALAKGITLKFYPPVRTQQYVMLDKLRIQQIFVNILNNAIKFTPRGGLVEFRVDLMEQTKEREVIRFTIADNGIGMSEHFLKNQLFKPFAQENPGYDNEETGTGLGMSIVKQLIELMGGSIECSSVQGEGTTFVVSIPVETYQNYNRKMVKSRKVDLEFLHGKKLLLCEDHPLNQEIAVHILKKIECIVDIAENGLEGVTKFRDSEEGYYDAVLMDVRMPWMDGLEATTAIREMEREDAKKVPVIAMTANAFQEDVDKCLSVGMNAHLSKPINPQEVYETLYYYISRR